MADPIRAGSAEHEAFARIQERTLVVATRIRDDLQAGMSERDIEHLARVIARSEGLAHWFRPPEARIEPGPGLLHHATRRRLHPGMHVELLLMPATQLAFGHVATTFAWRGPEHPLLEEARATTRAVCGFANRWKCTGELFVFARAWANNHRIRLADVDSIGFAVFPPGSRLPYPLSAWARSRLRRHQIQFFNPRRLDGLWAVRPRVAVGRRAAAFGELLLIDGERKHVLGRNDLSEVGQPLPLFPPSAEE